MNKLEQPLNSNERYLYGISVRLEVLIDMFSSFLNVYANQNDIVSTENVVEEVEVVEKIGQDFSLLTKKQIAEKLDEANVEYKSTDTKADLVELANKFLN